MRTKMCIAVIAAAAAFLTGCETKQPMTDEQRASFGREQCEVYRSNISRDPQVRENCNRRFGPEFCAACLR